MTKYLIYTIIFLGIVVIGFNITILDFDDLLKEESGGAMVAIVATLCVLVVMGILLISRTIAKKQK